MNKENDLNKKLFNRLFLKIQDVRRLKIPIKQVNNIKLEKSIRYIYYSKEKKLWFAYSESKNKFLYFFGTHDGHINNLNNIDNSLLIDFDKHKHINNHSVGLINESNMEVYLNYEILQEKYPNYNFRNFKKHVFGYFEKSKKIEIETIELGKLYGTFFNNLEKLINELPLSPNFKETDKSNNLNLNSININLFLNAIKAGKTYEQSLKIAKIDSTNVRYWYRLGKKGNEKYVEFYEVYKEIMPRDEIIDKKMKLFIDSLKSGKTEEESLSYADATSSDLNKWVKNGKNGELEFIDFYEEYFDITKKIERKSNSKNKQKDQEKIQDYIKLINEGKTNKEAFETLNIPRFKTKNWKQQGQLGNKDYQEFYETYKKAVEREKSKKVKITNKKNQELIQDYIKLINEGKTNKEAFETLNIPRFKTKNWKQQGQLGNKDYQEFYETYLKAVKREEFEKINQFISLVNNGKSNEEAIRIIRIPEYKIKQWFNNGKNGEKEYIEFYKAYMNQYDAEIEIEKNIPTQNIKPIAIEEKKENKKTCAICGRSMREKDTNTICKRCRRKQRCATIVNKLSQSIESEILFKKEDLKKLGLTSIQIQDYIWMLQEFNLIKKEKNNKFSLVKKEIIDKFIKESGIEIIEEQSPKVKLTKTCNTCGKTLEISKFPVSENSPDGYENNCKDCKKLITTATYLKEILNYFKFDQEFSEEDLTKFIKDPFLRQAKIWSLMDNDLIIKNLDTNNYNLADKEKCNEFIEKYYQEKTTPPKSEPKGGISPPIETNPIKNKQEQMEIVLQARKEGKTRKEAAKLAEISLYKITHWYKEGRDGFGEDNIYFYKELKKVETNLLKKLKKQMNTVLKVLKTGGSESEAIDKASITKEDLDNWIKKGKNDIKPYKSFLREYLKYMKQSTDYDNKNNIKSREKFIKYITQGKTRKEAAKKASINLKLLDSWIIKGTKGQKPYDEFYKEYKKARESAKGKSNSNEDKIKKQFIELLEKGFTLGEASKQIEKGKYAVDIKKWYTAGKQGVSKHLKFHMQCQVAKNNFKTKKNKIFTLVSDGFTIKESCKKLKLDPFKIKNELLKGKNGEKPYDEFYNKIIESKTSLIDMKQLFKSPNHPHKDQMVDFLDLLLIGENETDALKSANIDEVTFKYWINRGKQQFGELYKEFYEIYNQLKSGELLNKFKKDIENELDKELDEIVNENPNILEMLPKQTRKELNILYKDDFTGFAWVTKIDNLWTYTKRVNNRTVTITDRNIYNLHKKVINNNFKWGVRDLKKAKQTLDLNIDETDDEESISSDILSPLPANIKTKFSKGTKTGFAWVNKVGNYFYYIRANKNIRIKAITINELYHEVINNNLDWGVIDLKKAKKTLNEKITKPAKLEKTDNDILAPLPKNIEKELQKYSKGSKTGFAWVGKSGKKYSYERVVNGKHISIREFSIHELHKKVLLENLTWGVRDLEKAKQTLSEKVEETKLKTISEPITMPKNIFEAFPKECEHLFKSNPKNKSGIAWVSKMGNQWIYSRQKNGKLVKYEHANIFKLHKKVIEANQLWGIRDFEKAKISLLSEPIDDEDYILSTVSNNELVNYDDSETGFALVKKVGELWEYDKPYNGVKITDKNIFGLFEKILDKNLLWGVTDIQKAIKSLEIEKFPGEIAGTNQIKESENNITDDILAPLPKQIDKKLRALSEGTSTGFAWVIRKGQYYVYKKRIDGKIISISDLDIYELFKKVKNENQLWGVRDLSKAIKTIEKSNQRKIKKPPEEIIATDIFSPLTKEHEKSFKIPNKSGFAWVSKIGAEWIYKRKIYGEDIIIKDSNIERLYQKVTEKQLTWGVRDLEKAKISVGEKFVKQNNINDNILKPLPIEIEQKLRKNSKGNTSGFAWVSKIGDKWQYTRVINGTPIHLKDTDIFKLHEIVVKNNYLWGVRDLTKAKQTLKDCNKKLPEPPKIDKIPKKTVQKSFDTSIKQNTDILAPLESKYEKTFKSSPTNKTGIAWVNKIGNNWIYSRQIDGKPITLKDTDIYQLHKKVLDKNLPWGVRDPEKARKIIFNAQPNQTVKINEENTVFVTLNDNIVSIDGKIKNKDVLKVLTKIYEFGDNILKLNTHKDDNKTTLSIELKLNKSERNEFKNNIKDFGWKLIE